MKNFIALLTLSLAAATSAQGETFQQDGISYETLTREPATCRVTGAGNLTGQAVIPATVEYGGVTWTVTEIGDAFNFCEGLTSVSIPETVTSIGMSFCRCPGLTEIVIPNSVTTISQGGRFNENLRELTIGRSVTKLENAFLENPALKNVFSLPDVPPVGYAFGGCDLSRCVLFIPKGAKNAYSSTNRDDFFPTSRFGKVIEADMSAGTTGLHGYDFTDGGFFYDIVSEADRTCSLTWGDTDYEVPSGHLVIPSKAVKDGVTYTVTEIAANTFKGVKGVTELTLPASVKKIGQYAFSGINPKRLYALGMTPPEGDVLSGTSHSTLFVPVGAKEAWRNWGSFDRIKEADLSGNLSGIISCDFISGGVNYVILSETDRTCAASWSDKPYTFSGKLDIPDAVTNAGKEYKVTVIDRDAFRGCEGISELRLPNMLDSIGLNAFSGCTALKAVAIPDNVRGITWMCVGCTALESVTLGKNLKALNGSFDGCTAIRLIRIFNPEPPKMSRYDFSYDNNAVYDNARVLVPPAAVERYKKDGTPYAEYAESGWCVFKNIEADPEQPDTRVIVDGINYELADNGAVVVASSAPYAGSVTIPERITVDGREYPVTAIGEFAFDGCEGITELVIPASVESLGYRSIYNCPQLTKVVIADGQTPLAKKNSNSWQNINPLDECPLKTLYIGREILWPIYTLDELTSLTFGNSLTKVSGISGCSKLTAVEFPESVTEIDGFNSCYQLTTVKFPRSVTKIVGFNSCSALASVTFPESLRILNGFSSTAMTSLTFNEGLDSICGFNNLRIVSLKLPASLRSVDGFNNTDLTSVELPESLVRVGGFEQTKLQSVKLPASLRYVSGFCYCAGIKSVEIPDNVVWVSYAFYGCNALETVRIGKNVLEIYSSFRSTESVSALREVVVGSSVGFMSENCFLPWSGTPTIEKVWMLPNTPPNDPLFLAYLVDGAAVYVPLGSLEAYRSNQFCANCNLVEMDLSNMETYDCEAGGVYVDVATGDNTTCTVTSGDSAYSGEVVIPETVFYEGQTYTVTVVGTDAFADNTELTGVTVPSTVTTICSGAFSGCTSLANVTLGESVAEIAPDAFAGSGAITEVHSRNPEPPAVKVMTRSTADLFEPGVYAGATLYVPLGSSSAYKSAPAWSRFASIVEEKSGVSCVGANDAGIDVRVDGGRILVSGIEAGNTVALYSVDGRAIASLAHNNGEAELDVESPGIYILRIGTKTVKIIL